MLLCTKSTLPHKLLKVNVKQIQTSAELSFELPFGMHPHILDVLCMHYVIVQDNDGMHIESIFNCFQVHTGAPSVGYNVASRKNILCDDLFAYLLAGTRWLCFTLSDSEALSSHIVYTTSGRI